VNIGGVSFETAVNYSIKSAEQLVAEKAFKRIEEEQGREKIYEINKESDE
jgi:outer membrane protease